MSNSTVSYLKQKIRRCTNPFHKKNLQKVLTHVIELEERDKPKKMRFEYDGYADGFPVYDRAFCPNCEKEFIEYEDDDWGCNYCPDCGQHLDWEMEEE